MSEVIRHINLLTGETMKGRRRKRSRSGKLIVFADEFRRQQTRQNSGSWRSGRRKGAWHTPSMRSRQKSLAANQARRLSAPLDPQKSPTGRRACRMRASWRCPC